MSDSIITYLLPILLVAVGTFATGAWVMLRSDVSTWWKALLIPAAFVGAVAMPLSVGDLFGRAFPLTVLPDQVIVFAHKTIIQDGKKKRIEIWTAERNSPTRLYSVPYSKPLEKLLETAEKGRQQGMQTELKRRKKGEQRPEGDKQDDSPYGLDFKRPEDLMPRKDGAPSLPPGHPPIEELLDSKKGTMI